MGIKEEAIKLHDKGCNCAQSVLCACGKYTDLDEKTAMTLSAGFGGGVRCGEICGSVSGAVMALGCAFPFADATDAAAKAQIAELTKKCTSEFNEHFGCIRCFELKKSGHSCGELIEYGAELAEKLITENKEV